jgi:hypothetical protein
VVFGVLNPVPEPKTTQNRCLGPSIPARKTLGFGAISARTTQNRLKQWFLGCFRTSTHVATCSRTLDLVQNHCFRGFRHCTYSKGEKGPISAISAQKQAENSGFGAVSVFWTLFGCLWNHTPSDQILLRLRMQLSRKGGFGP